MFYKTKGDSKESPFCVYQNNNNSGKVFLPVLVFRT